jgi:hypothetical protein
MTGLIIGLGHVKQSGKDTAANALVTWKAANPFAPRFRKVAFADALRAVALGADPIIDGPRPGLGVLRLSDVITPNSESWEEAKKAFPEVRRFLQALGTEGVRNNLGSDVWVRALFDHVGLGENVVIPDVRYVNEAEAIKARGGIVVRIDRPGHVASGHLSETALADWDGWDAVILNNRRSIDLLHEIRGLVQDHLGRQIVDLGENVLHPPTDGDGIAWVGASGPELLDLPPGSEVIAS